MKLITKEIKNKLPKIYETDGQAEDKKIAYVIYFCPWGEWTWYGFEFDGKDLFFGYVKGDYNELGYFTLSELESVKGYLGLGIERDLYFTPKPLSEIKERS